MSGSVPKLGNGKALTPGKNGHANGHTNGHAKSNGNGFALDLSNGAGDAHDAEFEQY